MLVVVEGERKMWWIITARVPRWHKAMLLLALVMRGGALIVGSKWQGFSYP
jgi:hypothetical protein